MYAWCLPPFPTASSAFEADSVVTQMINPEDNNLMAMLLGSLAPCVSAPWWEEVREEGRRWRGQDGIGMTA